MKTLHKRCAGLDVHKVEVVACLRLISKRKVERQVRRFPTTTQELLALAEWLESAGCTHVAMEATGTGPQRSRVLGRLHPMLGLGSMSYRCSIYLRPILISQQYPIGRRNDLWRRRKLMESGNHYQPAYPPYPHEPNMLSHPGGIKLKSIREVVA